VRAGPRATAGGGDALGLTTCETRSAAGSWSLTVARCTHAHTHTHARTRTHTHAHAHTHTQASFNDAHTGETGCACRAGRWWASSIWLVGCVLPTQTIPVQRL
jgi:hypothetical protein